MKILGAFLVIAAILIMICLALAAPYVVWIGWHYGWLDPRIEWSPFGVPASILALGLSRAGFAFIEAAEKP